MCYCVYDCAHDCGEERLVGNEQVGKDGLTEVNCEGDSGGEDERADQFDGDDELHAKAERAAKVAY